MNRMTLLAALCMTLLTACKDGDDDTGDGLGIEDCIYWCPDFDGDGRGEFSAQCEPYCLAPDVYPPNNGCMGTPYVANCDEVRPPFPE